MRVGFAGFTYMDGKGEENNEVAFLKRMANVLVDKNADVTYFHRESLNGIDMKDTFDHMEIPADRVNIEQYTNFPFNEFKQYSDEEIAYGYKGHIPEDKSYKDQAELKRNNINKIIRGLENVRIYTESNPVDLFIVFGNYLISNIVKVYCRKHNIKYLVLENGYFRPFTLMADPNGVNFESSIPKDLAFYQTVEVDEVLLKQFIDKPQEAYADREYTFEERKKFYKFFDISIEEAKTRASVDSNLSLVTDSLKDINAEYIYVPFQLETDSQITKHSPSIKTMKHLVELTSEALMNYNRNNNKNLKIIYKVHPLYESELHRMDLAGIEEICAGSEELILLKKGNNQQLLEQAKMVITINSTVGFEALLQYKNVITLGEAFYAIDGISTSWSEGKDLENLITRVIERGPNIDNIKRFIYHLRFNYFAEIFWKNPDLKSMEKLVEKII
ncbi:hypothetical protein RGU11_02775 [Rossellomorea marisflavi]|uniref:capsular polysaccharide export protein, LipB/KpsS family n=1 Tax=Rossellomorea marisflavi TaxID=189381 RepID=UPI0028531CE9|nr:hypothetical protein [Rossellomorea marisflavi]MDR4935304.1 hypothetical protein [Rossellomorea marisflavi]